MSFGFDPYSRNLLEVYLPDGYITINGEYDATELIVKTFFDPVLENDNLKYLIIDLNTFLKNPNQKKISNIKMLVEKLAFNLAKQNRTVGLGFKFKYDQNSNVFIDQLFNYTIVATTVNAIQLESGYSDFYTTIISKLFEKFKIFKFGKQCFRF